MTRWATTAAYFVAVGLCVKADFSAYALRTAVPANPGRVS